MSDDAKLRFLFEKVQHPELKLAISALQVKVGLGEKVSCISAANHLAAQLSTTQDFRASQDRWVGISAISGTTPEHGIMRDGRIYTGYYKNFFNLDQKDQDALLAERKKKGEQGAGSGGSKSPRTNQRASATKTKKELVNLKQDISKTVNKQVIAALKRKLKAVTFEEP